MSVEAIVIVAVLVVLVVLFVLAFAPLGPKHRNITVIRQEQDGWHWRDPWGNWTGPFESERMARDAREEWFRETAAAQRTLRSVK